MFDLSTGILYLQSYDDGGFYILKLLYLLVSVKDFLPRNASL